LMNPTNGEYNCVWRPGIPLRFRKG
jgi:hypothetical protein